MATVKSLKKPELIKIIENIIDEVKDNEGMGIARILADYKLISEVEYEAAISF